ncbi:MAG: hypothetical protein ACC656_10390 [Candidatus Heimdallarchaeota archaeon]
MDIKEKHPKNHNNSVKDDILHEDKSINQARAYKIIKEDYELYKRLAE